ncbi:MAG: TIR domain-containing protein [Candidatus Korobacteraceae bacterium]|jgi:hypothetical protein
MRVFLSHSVKDGTFVQRLADALCGAGFNPWRCEVDVETGANFVSRINDGLAQSDVALLVWSPDAAASAWTEWEWTSLLARQVAEHKIRLGVVMLREHPLPPLLNISNYIDARSDQTAALRGIIKWLQKRHEVRRLSGPRAPVYLPDYRPEPFVGRTLSLEKLRTTFEEEPRAFLLFGEPGAGKSTLALRFAWNAQKDYDAVIFQLCGQRPLDAITADLIDRLPIDVKACSPKEQRVRASEWLLERQSLLVLDDVWSPEVKELQPGPPCCVLYTSRYHSLPWISPSHCEEVKKFEVEEAEELFHAYLDCTFGEGEVTREREALLNFAQHIERLPIAITVGANLIRERPASTLRDIVKGLHVETLGDASALYRTAILRQDRLERRLLNACAVCSEEGFWLPLAAEIAGLGSREREEAANRLAQSSMLQVLDRGRRLFHLHALLRVQLRMLLGDRGVRGLEHRRVPALEKRFNEWQLRPQECRECLGEILSAASFLHDNSEVQRAQNLARLAFETARNIGEPDVARVLQTVYTDLGAG